MGDKLSHLEKHYCPPIDSSLFFAIVLDYDLTDSVSFQELCVTLDELKASALAEEGAQFDPSGSSGLQSEVHNAGNASSDLVDSWLEDFTSSSSAAEGLNLGGISQISGKAHLETTPHDQAIERLSDPEKEATLKEMFPETKAVDIEWIFKKARYNFGEAVEELLNQAFFDEEGIDGRGSLVERGVDGFSESNSGSRRKKRKKKNGRRGPIETNSVNDEAFNSSSLSRWDRVREDINFLEQRTFISREVLSSEYHKSGASLSSTIAALCASEHPDANPYITADETTVMETHTLDLAPRFPSLTYAQISALIRLSHPSTASATELGHALVTTPSSTSVPKIIPQYVPRPPSPNEKPDSSPVSMDAVHLDPSKVAALANNRGAAFIQAQAAFRKAKSNPHFGGAAAYYSQVGRDASAALRNHGSAAADALVAGQSRPGEVDLHGVSARDAVRISKQRVSGWWDREAQEWSRTGKPRGEFRIVTGQGHHSTGGKGVLGPAVFKALMTEGWKVKMEQGYIVVSGQVRK